MGVVLDKGSSEISDGSAAPAPGSGSGSRPGVGPTGPLRRTITIVNKLGLHARPAMQFVDTANLYQAHISVIKGDQVVDAKSIMDMLTLAATCGTALVVEADGPDAAAALAALDELVARKFDED